MSTFDILQHLEKLKPVEGKSTVTTKEYYCPLCGAENFKVDLPSGRYNTWGCDCNSTPKGKRQVIDAIAPATWDKPTPSANHQEFTYERLVGDKAEDFGIVVEAAISACRADAQGVTA